MACTSDRHFTPGERGAHHGIRVDRATKALALSRLRYEAGQVGYLEVLDAERTLQDAQLAAIAARQTRLDAAVGLFKALGGGWRPIGTGDAPA